MLFEQLLSVTPRKDWSPFWACKTSVVNTVFETKPRVLLSWTVEVNHWFYPLPGSELYSSCLTSSCVCVTFTDCLFFFVSLWEALHLKRGIEASVKPLFRSCVQLHDQHVTFSFDSKCYINSITLTDLEWKTCLHRVRLFTYLMTLNEWNTSNLQLV